MISQKICKKKLIFKHKNDIILPSMTFEFIGHFITIGGGGDSLANFQNHHKKVINHHLQLSLKVVVLHAQPLC